MASLETGTVIGNYRIQRAVGRGGMGVVYLATQLGLNRRVALKVIAPDLAEDPGYRDRFKQEAEVAALRSERSPLHEIERADCTLSHHTSLDRRRTSISC